VDDISYQINSAKTMKSVGHNMYARKTAGSGAQYLVIKYTETNIGKKTEDVSTNRFKLVTSDGKEYSPASDAETALRMDDIQTDYFTQLQPNIQRNAATVFEVPTRAYEAGARLEVSSGGVFSSEKVLVVIK
jgi:hypothetical protein